MGDSDDDYEEEQTSVGLVLPKISDKSRRDRPCLIALTGPNVGEMYPVGAETYVGRGANATVRLHDDSISRRHVRIAVDGNSVRLEDLASANGTFVNGARVQAKALQDGDKIQLGASTILKFTYHDELEEDFQRQMRDAAMRDPLTKLYNKKYLLERLEAEIAFARRHDTPLAFVLMDVDHFKSINDTHGHLVGDYVLANLATTVQATLRTEDMFARYGGEEFAIVCRSAALADARIVAERVRATVARTSFAFDGRNIPVTVSAGAAVYSSDTNDATALIGAADEALYEAKRAGRNRIVVR